MLIKNHIFFCHIDLYTDIHLITLSFKAAFNKGIGYNDGSSREDMQSSCCEPDKELILILPAMSKKFFYFHLLNLSEQQTTSKSAVLTQTKASLWHHT